MFIPFTNSLVTISWIESAPACPSLWCQISKLTTECSIYANNTFDHLFASSTTYNWPLYTTINTIELSYSLTSASLSLNMTLAPLDISFNIEIRFDLRFSMYRTLFSMMFVYSFPEDILIFTDLLSVIWKLKLLTAPRLVIGWPSGIYELNGFWSVKQ